MKTQGTKIKLYLDSVGSVVEQSFDNSVFVYPMKINGKRDCNCPTEIDEVSDEWWEALSDADFLNISDNINLKKYLKEDSFYSFLKDVQYDKGMESLVVFA